jgi:hypothetical protein
MSSKGKYFVVGLDEIAKAAREGVNPTVAYLVLAAFTGPDNRRTRASVNDRLDPEKSAHRAFGREVASFHVVS